MAEKRLQTPEKKFKDSPVEVLVTNPDEVAIATEDGGLIIDFEDGDKPNHKRENIRFLCYNCFHNLRGNLRGKQPQWRAEQIKQAKLKQKKSK